VKYILALDIGGTYTRLAMVEVSDDFKIAERLEISSAEIKNITDTINNFLRICGEKGLTTDTCVISMAGPIENNACKKPHHVPFPVDGNEIKANSLLGKVMIINDFAAVSFGVLALDITDRSKIIAYSRKHLDERNRNIVVIGAGTGLGTSYITKDNGRYFVHESEGGHISFDFLDLANSKLSHHLQKEKALDYDSIVSGRGIRTLFEFHKQELPTAKQFEILSEKDVPKKICEMYNKDPVCKKVIKEFLMFYARFAQIAALTFIPKGGIYIAGGIARKHIEFFKDGFFMHVFMAHPTMSHLLKEIPVYFVMEKDVALYGCAMAAIHKN